MKTGSFPFKNKHQLIILILLAFGLNFNTLFNEYALDDIVVITENKFVEKGIGGIPELISQSYFNGCDKVDISGFSGGRYRPFSLVIFAIEHQFFGENPFVSHLINILFFTLLIALLYKLLHTYIFREQHPYLAFVTCLLFVVHPIHTEVIANVKSRDELITFILLIVSLITFIKHIEKKNWRLFFSGLFCFFLALLTRESAVTFIGIVPLTLYFFFNQSIKKVLVFTLPLIAILIAYMLLRVSIVGLNISNITSIENAPFLLATASQAFATKVFIIVKYISLLIFPHPLSWDYGYNQIPYIEINSIPFSLSVLLIICMLAYAIFTFKKKSIFSFCILYFIITMSLVTNFVVDTGTPLSERLLFQPSLAFCIAVAVLYFKALEKIKFIPTILLLIILTLFSVKTFTRNSEWKNNETLFLTDADSSPNCIRAINSAINICLEKAHFEKNAELKNDYLKKSIYLSERSLKIAPDNLMVIRQYLTAYFVLLDYYKSLDAFFNENKFDTAGLPAIITEQLSDGFYKQGNGLFEKGNVDEAIKCYSKAIEFNNNNVEAWYNLGGNYFFRNDSIKAIQAWEKVKILAPGHEFKKADFLK